MGRDRALAEELVRVALKYGNVSTLRRLGKTKRFRNTLGNQPLARGLPGALREAAQKGAHTHCCGVHEADRNAVLGFVHSQRFSKVRGLA